MTNRIEGLRLPRNGATDDLGLLQARSASTILQVLGFDHTKLAYVQAGRLEGLAGTRETSFTACWDR